MIRNVRNNAVLSALLLWLMLSCGTAAPVVTPLPVAESMHVALGNPTNAKSDGSDPDNLLLVKDQYTLSYNRSLGHANWVAWELTDYWLGAIDRQDDFRPDPALPAGDYRVLPSDYTGSGFDRGHLCPSADRTLTAADNSSTFLMSNMIPQAPELNREPWARFETYCRDLAKRGFRLYIIAGAYGVGGEGSKGYAERIGKGNVSVPARNYKIVVAVANGGTWADVNSQTPVIALDFPNVGRLVDNKSWSGFVSTAADIEKAAGVSFFTYLPADVRAAFRTQRFDPTATPL